MGAGQGLATLGDADLGRGGGGRLFGRRALEYLGQDNPLLDRLGKYTIGKGCLYIKRLSDVDASALEAIIARGWNRPTESAG